MTQDSSTGTVPIAVATVDTDADRDTGSDTDVDVASDKDSDASSDTDSDMVSNMPWTWVDNPQGVDGGVGCVKLTFEDGVNESQWDIWEDTLVYSDRWCRIFVVDILNRKTLQIPDVYPEYKSRPDGTSDSRGVHPTIFQQTVFYSLGVSSTPYRYEIVRTDLAASTQQVIWQREEPFGEEVNYHIPDYLDLFGDILVTRSSTGNPLYRTLGFHKSPWANDGQVIIDKAYGGLNSLWENTLVFWELDGLRENIRGYDFKTNALFSVTDDDEFQFYPRIHKRRVVYMDLRLGESDTSGTWEHGAIFVKDLDSGEVKQITDGVATAGYPDIHDDIVVWMDWRNCPNPNNKNDISAIEIWGHNLATGTTSQITNLPEYQKGYPRIWKDKVYVHMFEGTKNGIYMFDVPASLKTGMGQN